MNIKRRYLTKNTYLLTGILFFIFLLSSLIFMLVMMRKNIDESKTAVAINARQSCIALQKQIQGDFQTLDGIAQCLSAMDHYGNAQLTEILQKINDNNNFIRMGIATLAGEVTLIDVGGESHPGFQLSDLDFFQTALNGQNAVSNTIADSIVPGQSVYYYVTPIYNADGNIGSVLCAVNSSLLLREIIDLQIENNDGFSAIVDSRGQFVLRANSSTLQAETPNTLDEFGVIESSQQVAMGKALMKGDRADFDYEVQGKRYYAVLEPLGINDWFVLSSVPATSLRQGYDQTALGMSLIILLASLLFLLLVYRQHKISSENETKLAKLAYIDSLTGHPNLTKFIMDAEIVIHSQEDRHFAVWYCNLKKFKYFNNLFGYQEGDRLLCQFASLLSRLMASNGLFCRISADKFAGLLEYKAEGELSKWFSTLQSSFHREELSDNGLLRVDLCIGFYCVEPMDSALSINDMINRAIMAENSVKTLPGSRFALFTGEIRESALRDTEMEAHCQQAIREQEFLVYFQPKINIQNGNSITGAEALVRWKHPSLGLVQPGNFIPLFEKNGFIVHLDRYMFEHVCAWLQGYLKKGNPPITVAVNVSRLGLLREDFIEYYASVKDKYEIPDKLLELEFTESIFWGDDAMFKNVVDSLHERGFVCSLDDFGSGYSSLNLLKNLPIDVLKLDILFFRKSVDTERERIVISNVVNMARQLRISTIAEGVEAAEQVEFLRETGCDTVQGYVFARPMPLADFDALLYEKSNIALEPQ